jgi:hypothetical protein
MNHSDYGCFKDDQQEWEEWTLENSSRAKLVEESRLWLLAMKVLMMI